MSKSHKKQTKVVSNLLALPASQLESILLQTCIKYPEVCNFIARAGSPNVNELTNNSSNLLENELSKLESRLQKSCKFYEREKKKGFHNSALADSFESTVDWKKYITYVLGDMQEELNIIGCIRKKEWKKAYKLLMDLPVDQQKQFNRRIAAVIFSRNGRSVWNQSVNAEEELFRKALTAKEIFDEVDFKAKIQAHNDPQFTSSGDSMFEE